MKLGDVQVSRSKSTRRAPRKFPTHATGKPFRQPKMVMSVNESKRGPEKSRPVSIGKGKPTTDPAANKVVGRYRFYPDGSLRGGRTPT